MINALGYHIVEWETAVILGLLGPIGLVQLILTRSIRALIGTAVLAGCVLAVVAFSTMFANMMFGTVHA